MLLFFVGLTFPSTNLEAQNGTVTDTLTYAFLPALSYSSDYGLVGGGLVNRYHYKDKIQPFYSHWNITAAASTKGLFALYILSDKPSSFNTDMRLTTESFISRFAQRPFYGVGTYEKPVPDPDEDPDYYQMQELVATTEWLLRIPVGNVNNSSSFDLTLLYGLGYQTPFDNSSDQLIDVMKFTGDTGGWISEPGIGFLYEGRDNEFDPGKGWYASGILQGAHRYTGSSFNYLFTEVDLRTYTSFNLFRDIVFANRLLFQNSFGTVPYWKLPFIGGEDTMRGYPEFRFTDDHAIILNSELRTWVFSLPFYKAKFGGTLFLDAGRTYGSGDNLETLWNDLKLSYGFGINSSFFTEDFILRSDIGFSEEGYGIFFTAGYLF